MDRNRMIESQNQSVEQTLCHWLIEQRAQFLLVNRIQRIQRTKYWLIDAALSSKFERFHLRGHMTLIEMILLSFKQHQYHSEITHLFSRNFIFQN